jgi:hypothetical protein
MSTEWWRVLSVTKLKSTFTCMVGHVHTCLRAAGAACIMFA